MQIKGAIFDMDGTLIDSLGLWEVMWDAFGEKYMNGCFRPTEAEDKAIRTQTLKDAMEYIHKQYHMAESGQALLDMANAIIREFYAETMQLKPGVREFLDELKARGVKMCVASATGPKLLSIAMAHCGIEDYFSGVFSCGKIGKGKDQPDIYLMALEHLGTAKEETCVFEDSAVAIDTAHKLGLQTVAIYDKFNYGHEQMQKTADHYIADGETLMKLI